jgi:hypothetical protein
MPKSLSKLEIRAKISGYRIIEEGGHIRLVILPKDKIAREGGCDENFSLSLLWM